MSRRCRTFSWVIALLVSPEALAMEVVDRLHVNAYADIEYHFATLQDAPKVEGFRAHHTNIQLIGRPVDRVTVLTHVKFENGGTALSGSDDADGMATVGSGKVEIEAAWVQWAATPTLALRGGRYMTPYGHYGELRDSTPTFASVHIPDAIYRTSTFGGGELFPKLSSGFSLTWDPGPARAVLFVDNGFVEGNNAFRDDNLDPGVGLRVESDPHAPVTGHLVGYECAMGPDGQEGRHFAGLAGLSADVGRVRVISEAAVSANGSDVQGGAFAEVVDSHVARVAPFVRAEAFAADLDDPDDLGWEGTVGARVDLASGHVFLKAEHSIIGRTDGSRVGDLAFALVGWF